MNKKMCLTASTLLLEIQEYRMRKTVELLSMLSADLQSSERLNCSALNDKNMNNDKEHPSAYVSLNNNVLTDDIKTRIIT